MKLKYLAGMAMVSLAIVYSMTSPELELTDANASLSPWAAMTLDTPMTFVIGLRG
jgi:hypothetical protein